MVRRFTAKTYAKDILVEPNDFEVIGFDAPPGARLQISAWEHDAEDFEICLLASGDIRGDVYRTDRTMLRSESTSDFDGEYTFPIAGRFGIVISNVRAYSREKLVHIRLAWISQQKNPDQTIEIHRKSAALRSVPKGRISGTAAALLVLVCMVISAGAVCFVLEGPIAVTLIGLVLGVGSIFTSVLKREIRQAIGLEEE